MRRYENGELVVDTHRPVVVWVEGKTVPFYAFPAEDVRIAGENLNDPDLAGLVPDLVPSVERTAAHFPEHRSRSVACHRLRNGPTPACRRQRLQGRPDRLRRAGGRRARDGPACADRSPVSLVPLGGVSLSVGAVTLGLGLLSA